ncbi:hypothetical protein CVT24_010537, partial [Panaeolus cyanescens]
QHLIPCIVFAQLTSVQQTYKPTTPTGPVHATSQELATAIQQLRNAFPKPDSVVTDEQDLTTYGSSEHSYHHARPHAVIVRPHSTEDVVKIINIARTYRVPVVSYSGATSLEGHFSGVTISLLRPPHCCKSLTKAAQYPTGSICLDMSKMDKILNINVDDSDLTCQAGTRWEDINHTLKDRNIPLFFPLDPGPGATIGGMVGTGCSGTNAVRYGTARAEWILNLTVVLPNGEVIKTRSRARKSAAGFDTTKLFIGAEGTLGIVTEATLRLAPLLPTKVAVVQFPTVQHAVDAVQEALRSSQGSHIQCVELLDDNSTCLHLCSGISFSERGPVMSAINEAGLVSKAYPVKDTLFFKLQGDDVSVKHTANVIKTIVQKHGSLKFEFASTDEEAEELWQNRKYALMSSLTAYPGRKCWTTDVCVPVSYLPKLVHETKKDLKDCGLHSTIVGHVGDGNFHALILFDIDTEHEKASQAVHRLVRRAIAMDGTCTGEHGVGIGKKEYLVEELGLTTVAFMKTIKNVVDPLNIMNPGKLYPDEDENNRGNH